MVALCQSFIKVILMIMMMMMIHQMN